MVRAVFIFIYIFFCFFYELRFVHVVSGSSLVVADRQEWKIAGAVDGSYHGTEAVVDYVTLRLTMWQTGATAAEEHLAKTDRKDKNRIRLSGQNGRWQLVPSRQVRRRRRRNK